MSPTSYQAAPPRTTDSTRLTSVLQILSCSLRVQFGGSGIISLDLCEDPTLGDDEEGSTGLSAFVTPRWLRSALGSLRQVLIKLRKRFLSMMSWVRVPLVAQFVRLPER